MPTSHVTLQARDRGGAGRVRSAVIAAAAGGQKPREPLPAEPLGSGAEAIFPVLEGWGPHKDGSTVILLGYYNRNRTHVVRHPDRPRQPHRARRPRLRPADALRADSAARRIRHQGAAGIRHQQADLDAEGQRPGGQGHLLAESAVLGRFLQERGERQRTAGGALRSRWPGAHRPAARVRPDPLGRGRPASGAPAVGQRSGRPARGSRRRAGGDPAAHQSGGRSGRHRRRQRVRRRRAARRPQGQPRRPGALAQVPWPRTRWRSPRHGCRW